MRILKEEKVGVFGNGSEEESDGDGLEEDRMKWKKMERDVKVVSSAESKAAAIFEKLCIGCGICVQKCPFVAITIIKDLLVN